MKVNAVVGLLVLRNQHTLNMVSQPFYGLKNNTTIVGTCSYSSYQVCLHQEVFQHADNTLYATLVALYLND